MVSITDRYYTVPQAARKLGLTRQRVYQLIKEGKLKFERISVWDRFVNLVPRSMVDREMARRERNTHADENC